MRVQGILVVAGIVLTACTGGGSVTTEQSGASPSPGGSTAPGEDSLTCWISPTEGEPGPIRLAESTHPLGLVEPLTGLHGHAAAFGDIDGDDAVDLLVGTFGDRPAANYQVRGAAGPASDQLLLSVVNPVSSEFLMDELGRTSGAVFADLDSDGDDDILLVRHAGSNQSEVPSRIYQNQGDGQFDITEPLPDGFYGRTPAVADFDMDGLLDIYVSEDKHGSRGGLLLHNDGQMRFEDVTANSGLADHFALSATAADLNDDARPDVVTSRGIFVNEGGMKFLDMTPEFYVAEPSGGEDDPAGVAVGDVNRDTIPDIVLGQHNRLTVEQDVTTPVRLFIGLAVGSPGSPVYEEVTAEVGLTPLPTLAPHVEIADMDNDGWPDIVTSSSAAGGSEPAIFRNTGGDSLAFETPQGLGSDQYWVGAPVVDLDRDGRLDVFALEWEPSLPSLMFLGTGSTGHWLEVSVGESGRGVGAVVTVAETDGTLIGQQEIGVSKGYASGHLPVAHFGLGPIDVVDVTIDFPDGEKVEIADIPADGHIRWPDGCG